METRTVQKCDRCGAETASERFPVGWTSLRVQSERDVEAGVSAHRDLCWRCKKAFDRFMDGEPQSPEEISRSGLLYYDDDYPHDIAPAKPLRTGTVIHVVGDKEWDAVLVGRQPFDAAFAKIEAVRKSLIGTALERNEAGDLLAALHWLRGEREWHSEA